VGTALQKAAYGNFRNTLYQRLQAEAARLPGVESAALASWFPLGFEGGDSAGVKVPGYTPAPGESMSTFTSLVSPQYFSTLKIPIVSGREFNLDDDTKQKPVAVINEAFAKKYFAGRDPIGLTFNMWRGDLRIVGLVPTGKYYELNEPAAPYFYLCTQQFGTRDLSLAVRTSGDPGRLARAVEQLGVSLNPYGRPHAAMTFDEFIGAAFTIPRVAATLLALLGALALLLAMLGIYAVISQGVGQRIRELGVRLALGAQPRDLRGLILGQGLRLAAIGVVLGALAAVGVSRLLSSLLVGISAADLVTWLLVPLLLLIAAIAACWLPARRASRVDPMVALRSE
ncbi:MAG TPA: ABC transporter permease, partial [Verrucomicrobiota bacterium]|nr:ABC transporter permease [Verrucomicrobiota bacterium]